MVCKEDQPFPGFRIDITDTSQSTGIGQIDLSERFVNAPVPMLVRVSKICSSNVATDTHCVAVGATPQTSFNIAKALAERDLGKSHREELIAGGHALARSRHGVQRHRAIELLSVNEICNLCEDEASGVHPLLRINLRPDGQPVRMRHTHFSSLAA